MKTRLAILAVFVGFLSQLSFAAASLTNTVTFNLTDWLQVGYTNRDVTIRSLSSPRTNPPYISVNYLLTTNSGSNATFTLTNMLDGSYEVSIVGKPNPTAFTIYVPTNNPATWNASSLIATNIDPNSTVAYTRGAANGFFVSKAGTNAHLRTNNGFVWIDVTNSGGGSGSGDVTTAQLNNTSNVLALQFSLTNALYVAINGDDTTGRRGVSGKPFATVNAAISNAVTGDTVFVSPGVYYPTNIAKAGVTTFLHANAQLWVTNLNAQYSSLLADYSGAVTSAIVGAGDLVMLPPNGIYTNAGNGSSATARYFCPASFITATNSGTYLRIALTGDILVDLGTNVLVGNYGGLLVNQWSNSTVSVTANNCTLTNTGGTTNAPLAIWWAGGEAQYAFNRFYSWGPNSTTNGSVYSVAIYCGNDTANKTTTNLLHFTAKDVDVDCFAINGSTWRQNRYFINADRMRCRVWNAFQSLGGGYLYFNSQHLFGNRFSSLFTMKKGHLWARINKITGGYNIAGGNGASSGQFTGSDSGFNLWIDEIEDTGDAEGSSLDSTGSMFSIDPDNNQSHRVYLGSFKSSTNSTNIALFNTKATGTGKLYISGGVIDLRNSPNGSFANLSTGNGLVVEGCTILTTNGASAFVNLGATNRFIRLENVRLNAAPTNNINVSGDYIVDPNL